LAETGAASLADGTPFYLSRTMTTRQPSPLIPRPGPDEYLAYYGKYITLVPDGDLLAVLREQNAETVKLLAGLSPGQGDFAYAPGKWTVKEVVGHLSDAERVFAYRALRFARADATDLPGFDENTYVPNGKFGVRTVADVLAEFQAVRAATLHLAQHLDGEALLRSGNASGSPMSVRALLHVIAGHERHHVALLRERYQLA
jgi:hypothetical protein